MIIIYTDSIWFFKNRFTFRYTVRCIDLFVGKQKRGFNRFGTKKQFNDFFLPKTLLGNQMKFISSLIYF